jgi:TRAP transporter 4TM/12TM fusion protein
MLIGGQRESSGWQMHLVRWYSVGIILYHLYAAQFGAPEVMLFRSTHVAMYVGLCFLLFSALSRQTDRIPWYDLVLCALAWVPAIYILAEYEYVTRRYPYIQDLQTMDWIVATLAIVLAVEACRRSIGLALTILFAIFLAHALFGHYAPGPFRHSGVSPQRLLDHLFLTSSGLYGSVTGISATYVLMFVLLGAVLEKAKGGDLFMNIATGIMGKYRGGPGKAAVLASALFGSISGAAVANVYATGTFTIPLMIRTGFRARFAAAVEAVGSSSGQLVPPIMGSAAFLIADFTRTPYLDVAYAAIFPAFLYLFAVFMMIHLETAKFNIGVMPQEMVRAARGDIIKHIHVFLPLAVVVGLLIQRYTPFYAAYVGVLTTLLVAQIRAETRMRISDMIDAFELGARRIAPISAALFVAALIVGTVELTGLGLRFTSIVLSVTGENLLLTMILIMVSCIVLGMGLPTAAAYLVVAIFGAPALVRLGVEPLAAHLFIFYYAIISAITPPVAVAAYAAASIAGTPMQRTGLEAVRLGAAVYIVPFVMIYNPALIMIGDWMQITWALVTALVGVISVAAAVQGFLFIRTTIIERLMMGIGGIGLLTGQLWTDVAGFLLLLAVAGIQLLRQRRGSRKSAG